MPVDPERKLIAYPSSKYAKLVRAEAIVNEESNSDVVTKALKMYFDRLPVADQSRILQQAAQISKNSY